MPEPVIKVTDISKRYRIGAREEQAKTFAEQLKRTATYPIRNFQRIARMKNFQESNDPTEFWALRDINFEVQQGEVLGIIGHNGAGKSTLLKILSRITEPTTGRIEIKGRVSSLLEVGTGFHPELTGRDNVYMNGTILGMRKREIDAKFEEIVEFAGIAQHIDTPVKFYSSGMTVRLAFSVAAHLDPEILIVDEVLAVGDADFQRKCLGKMEEVSSGQGRTVLFVSHNMGSISGLCSRCTLINQGKIVKTGETTDIIDNYIESSSNFISNKINIKNRKGSGILKIEEIIINPDGSERNKFLKSGENAYFIFKINKSASNINSKKTRLDFRIDNARGERITWLSTNLKEFRIQNETIKFFIPKLMLSDGLYFLTICLYYEDSIADLIEKATVFTIESGNIYLNGKLPPKAQGVVLTEFHLS